MTTQELDTKIEEAIAAWNVRYEGMDGMASSHINKIIKVYRSGYLGLDELRYTELTLRRICRRQLSDASQSPFVYAATLRLHRLAEEVIYSMRARLHHLEGLLNG